MGLTIFYGLSLPASESAESARARLEQLRETAVAMGLEVTRLVAFAGPECSPEAGAAGPEDEAHVWRHFRVMAEGRVELDDGTEYPPAVYVPPLECLGFLAWPGRGAEPVALGVSRYPAVVDHQGAALPTRLDGWRWRGFCKTQYASVFGAEHFLRTHRAALALLEAAQALGFAVGVRDDGRYWETRDEAALLAHLDYMNRAVAAVAGRLADAAERAGLEAGSPIFRHPEFERLEMPG